MREISFDFHRMESICDELALFSDMFTKQVLSPLHNAYSVLDPEISGKVKTRFHAVMERASYLRGEQNNLAALIDYASNSYKKYDREAVNNLVEINEQAHLMLDGIQQELGGVAHGRSANTSGAFALMPDGYSRNLPYTSLRELGKVASFVVKEDQVDYSFTATALLENQATAYDVASPLHHFAFPKFDFHNEKMDGPAPDAGKFIIPAIVATGVGGAFYALHLQTKPSSGIDQKRVSGKKIASDSRVKTMTQVASKGALVASLSTGGLAVLKNHAKITFNARDKQNISANTVLFDAGEVGLPVRANEHRVIYDSLASLGFFTFGILVLPKFIDIESFRILVDTVSRDIFLKDYYQCIRNRSLDIDAFVVQHSTEASVSARTRLEDDLSALNLQKMNVHTAIPQRKEVDELNTFVANNTDTQQTYPHRTISQIHELDDFAAQNGITTPISARTRLEDELSALNLQKVNVHTAIPQRKEVDELNTFVANNTDAQQTYPHRTTGQIHELDDFAAQNGVTTPVSARTRLEDELSALNLQKADPQIKVPSRIETDELLPLIFQEKLDPQIIVPPSYDTEPLMRVIFPDGDNIPWTFLLKYDPNFTTWMERFDIRVRILPPDYRYIREFIPLADDGRAVMHKDMLAVGKLAGFVAQESEDAAVAGNTNRVSVNELDKFTVISETSDILWKHLVHRDADISEPQMKKDWPEILAGKFFTDGELDAGDQYERNLYDSVFAFLVKSVYVPELQKQNVSAASHISAVMGKVAMEDIENPVYASYTGNIAPPKKVNAEDSQADGAYPSGTNQTIASKATAVVEPLEENARISAGANEVLKVTANRVEAAELTAGGIRENIGGSSAFGANKIQALDMDAVYGAVLPAMAKASGARVDVSESELTSQFTQWSVSFTGNTYKGSKLSYVQSASAYLGAKTGAKAVDAREIEPANGNSANSVIVNAKKTQELELGETEINKNESAELTDQQIHAILSVLAGATIGTGIIFAAKKAAGALHNGGSYSLPEHVSFESLQKSAVSITGEMLISLAKYGVELGSIATLVDTVCKSVWTQGSAVSAVITYSSVALLSAQKIYNIYKG